MSEIEHTRTLGKVHHYSDKNIGLLIDPLLRQKWRLRMTVMYYCA